jgi:hypothetical protein
MSLLAPEAMTNSLTNEVPENSSPPTSRWHPSGYVVQLCDFKMSRLTFDAQTFHPGVRFLMTLAS